MFCYIGVYTLDACNKLLTNWLNFGDTELLCFISASMFNGSNSKEPPPKLHFKPEF